jgi:hypothetical protein
VKRTLDDAYEKYLTEQVTLGGGKYVGVQECEGWVYDLILFNAPSGSTLAVKSNVGYIPARVRMRLAQHAEDLCS